MKKNLSIQWTQHLKNDADKATLEATIRHSTGALGRLKQILEDQLAELEKDGSKSDYEKASWAYLQAHRNGEKAKVRELLSLLSFLN